MIATLRPLVLALALLALAAAPRAQDAAEPAPVAPTRETAAPHETPEPPSPATDDAPAPRDPTVPDALLLERLLRPADDTPVASGTAAPRPAVHLAGLVVAAGGGGTAILRAGTRLLVVRAGASLTLDAAGEHPAAVERLDARGVVLRLTDTDERLFLD